MANIVNVAGLASIKVDTGAVNALEVLGFTRDGAHITFQPFFLDVPGDENGGDAGTPIDVQHMGLIAHIRIHLTKWDEVIADKVRPLLYGGTAGTVGSVGALMFNDAKTYRLLIHSPTTPYNFVRTVFREPFEINKGTKYSEFILIGTAYKNAAGVLYNAVTA